MLSRKDIEKEIGKEINIYPLHMENIKENSINFTISKYAWTLGQGRIIHKLYNQNPRKYHYEICNDPDNKWAFTLESGQSCYRYEKEDGNTIDYIVLLPHTVTVVETEEVVAFGNRIGGAVHSKVGIVAQGVGDLGTMIGPGYCGHLMISLHNITNKIIALRVGDTFASITFDYLSTPIDHRTSATVSGHVDKFAELGIKLNEKTRAELTEDWKSNIEGIRTKMMESNAYKKYEERKKKDKFRWFKATFTKERIITYVLILGAFILMGLSARIIDIITKQNVWFDRFITVGCSGIIITILNAIYASRTKNK